MPDKQFARQYLSEFIESVGGPEKVAALTGINRQTVRQLYDKRNGARQGTLEIFAKTFHNFNMAKAGGYATQDHTLSDMPLTDRSKEDARKAVTRFFEKKGGYRVVSLRNR